MPGADPKQAIGGGASVLQRSGQPKASVSLLRGGLENDVANRSEASVAIMLKTFKYNECYHKNSGLALNYRVSGRGLLYCCPLRKLLMSEMYLCISARVTTSKLRVNID